MNNQQHSVEAQSSAECSVARESYNEDYPENKEEQAGGGPGQSVANTEAELNWGIRTGFRISQFFKFSNILSDTISQAGVVCNNKWVLVVTQDTVPMLVFSTALSRDKEFTI